MVASIHSSMLRKNIQRRIEYQKKAQLPSSTRLRLILKQEQVISQGANETLRGQTYQSSATLMILFIRLIYGSIVFLLTTVVSFVGFLLVPTSVYCHIFPKLIKIWRWMIYYKEKSNDEVSLQWVYALSCWRWTQVNNSIVNLNATGSMFYIHISPHCPYFISKLVLAMMNNLKSNNWWLQAMGHTIVVTRLLS